MKIQILQTVDVEVEALDIEDKKLGPGIFGPFRNFGSFLKLAVRALLITDNLCCSVFFVFAYLKEKFYSIKNIKQYTC